MDVQIAESGPCRRTLTIKIPATQVAAHIDRAFKAAAGQVDIKGFRKGHVPRSVLEKKYGPAIYAEAKEQLVRSSVADACREHQLATIGQIQLEGLSEEPLGRDRDVEFQVHMDVRPNIELQQLEGLEIRAESSAVTEEDLTRALADLAGQKRTLDTVEDAIGEQDFAKVDMTFFTADGNEVSKRTGVQINPGIPVAGVDPVAFRDQLTGSEKGSTIEFELTFPETFDKAEVRGQPGKVSVAIHEVLRVQDAPIDDELAKSFDFETLDAMREELHKQIGQQKELAEKHRQSDMLLDMVANETRFELPETLVVDEQKHSLDNFEKRLREAELGEDEIKAKLEEAQAPSREDAERRVRMFFLIDAIARQKGIGVSQGDFDGELARIAAQHGAPLEQVRDHYGQEQHAGQLRMMLLERNVREFLRDNATITDK